MTLPFAARSPSEVLTQANSDATPEALIACGSGNRLALERTGTCWRASQ